MKKYHKIIFIIAIILGIGLFIFYSLAATSTVSIGNATLRNFGKATTTLRNFGQATTTIKSIPSGGLVGFWNFDDCDSCSRAQDMSGNSNVGVFQTGDLHTGTLGGIIGRGVTVDGATQYISTGTTVWPTGNSAWTFSFWVKFNSQQAGQKLIIFYGTDGNAGGSNNIYLDINNCGADKIGVGNWGTSDIICNGSAVTYGRWYYVAVTHTNAPRTELFINGVSAGSETSTNYNITNSYHNIGRYDGGANTAASFDEYRVYNRALNAGEIANSYQNVLKRF